MSSKNALAPNSPGTLFLHCFAIALISNLKIIINLLSDLCQGVKCRFGARCEAGECVCPTNCSYSEPSELVCASNMITYPNECEMQKASCDLPDPLSIIFFGDCREKFSVPFSKSDKFFLIFFWFGMGFNDC